jgi:ABC-2 type transport system permease protein
MNGQASSLATGALRPYWAVLQARLRMLLQYRAAAAAGFVTQLFWGAIRMMAFEAFFRSSSAAQPLTLEQTISYVWLTQALLLLLPMRLDREVLEMIRTGTLAYELARPVDLYGYWYARNIAGRIAPATLRAIPMFLVAWLLLGLQLPASPASAAAFALSLVGAVLLSAAFVTLSTVTLLWTISGNGISRLLNEASWLLSGALVPLPLLPDWAQGALRALPFRGLMDTPFQLYIGSQSPREALPLFANQLLWTAALVLLGRWLLSRAARRLVIQGG